VKRAILLCLIFALLIISLNSKKTEAIQWWTSFNYKDLDEMKEAGWAITRPAGIRLVSAGVILDGVGGASAIGIYNEIPRGIFDWKVDDSLRNEITLLALSTHLSRSRGCIGGRVPFLLLK